MLVKGDVYLTNPDANTDFDSKILSTILLGSQGVDDREVPVNGEGDHHSNGCHNSRLEKENK